MAVMSGFATEPHWQMPAAASPAQSGGACRDCQMTDPANAANAANANKAGRSILPQRPTCDSEHCRMRSGLSGKTVDSVWARSD